MLQTLISWAQQVSTFTVGIITVVIGALVNAQLNRWRDDRLRAGEAKAVAAALYGEMLLMRKEIARTAQRVAHTYTKEPGKEFDQTLLEGISLRDPVLYPALASKLGLLAPDVVLGITKFQADFEAVRFWLPNLIKPPERKFHYSVLHVLKPAKEAVFSIDPTLRTIEKLLDIKSKADDPDMEHALFVIDIEDEVFSSPGG